MIKHILVGYDGSESAQRAFSFAMELAQATDAEVHVVSVLQITEAGSDASVLMMTDDVSEVEAGLKKELDTLAGDDQNRYDIRVIYGSPGDVLLAQIEEQNIDHLVVGHTDRGSLLRWLLGSVSDDVIAHASIPVTVIR